MKFSTTSTYNTFVAVVVGEPLNDEAWLWYHNVVGGGKATVVDTWWQTGRCGRVGVAVVV